MTKRPTRVPDIKTVALSDIQHANEPQDLQNAMVDIVDGLEARTEEPVLLSERSDGTYSIEDGFHRIAEAVMKGKKTIRADIISRRTRYARKPNISLGRVK